MRIKFPIPLILDNKADLSRLDSPWHRVVAIPYPLVFPDGCVLVCCDPILSFFVRILYRFKVIALSSLSFEISAPRFEADYLGKPKLGGPVDESASALRCRPVMTVVV